MADVVTVEESELTAITARGAGVLSNNGLVVAPAGMMYGLYANVASQPAADRVFAARRAPRTAPLPVVVHNPRQLPSLVSEVNDAAERLMAAYWPGPLTLIFHMAPNLGWHVGESNQTVALRMPLEPLALMLGNKVGPLVCTAAATAGSAAPLTVADARASLGDSVDLYLDGGPRQGEPSTIVDVSRGGAQVLREGAIPAHHVSQVAEGHVALGQRPVDPPEGQEDGPTADDDEAREAAAGDDV